MRLSALREQPILLPRAPGSRWLRHHRDSNLRTQDDRVNVFLFAPLWITILVFFYLLTMALDCGDLASQ